MSRVRLGDIVSRVKDFENKDNTDLLYYVGGEHFDNRSLTVNRKGIIKGSTIGPAFHTKFTNGDVLLMSRNPHLRKAGMVNFDGICSDVSYIIRTKDEKIIMQKFIPLLFQSDIFWNFAERNKKGSTNFFLNWSDFEKFEFDLPNIDEQQKLCDVLWAIDDTLKSYQEQIKQCDELVKGQFVEMFGELTNNTKGWPLKRLSDIAEYWNGLTYKPSDISKDGVIVLRASNIQDGELDFDDIVRVKCIIKEKLYVKENDILMCSRNGSAKLVGKVALITELNENISFGAFMEIIRSKYYVYLKVYMESEAFRTQLSMGTATINQITGNMLSKVVVPMPDEDSIAKFEQFYKHLDKSKFAIKEAMNNAQKIFDGILRENLC